MFVSLTSISIWLYELCQIGDSFFGNNKKIVQDGQQQEHTSTIGKQKTKSGNKHRVNNTMDHVYKYVIVIDKQVGDTLKS